MAQTKITTSGITDTNITNVKLGTDISATKITADTLADARIPDLNASKINVGTLTDARIPDLNASKINAGTLADARIPDLNASKITAGTIATARLGSGTADATTFLRGDGAYAAAGGGKIGQVISASKIDTESMTTSAFADVTGLSVTITPSATSSKIFWTFTLAGGDNTNYGIAKITYGDGSDLTTTARHESAGNRIRGTSGWAYTPNAYQTATLSGQGLDSPNTISATTYKIRIATSGTFYVNRSTLWYDNATTYAGIGSITVMEILA